MSVIHVISHMIRKSGCKKMLKHCTSYFFNLYSAQKIPCSVPECPESKSVTFRKQSRHPAGICLNLQEFVMVGAFAFASASTLKDFGPTHDIFGFPKKTEDDLNPPASLSSDIYGGPIIHGQRARRLDKALLMCWFVWRVEPWV